MASSSCFFSNWFESQDSYGTNAQLRYPSKPFILRNTVMTTLHSPQLEILINHKSAFPVSSNYLSIPLD